MNIEDILSQARKAFFAYRNGTVADALRRGGDPHPVIMGCQLTDVATIARGLEPDAALAQAFWNERNHRECRMIAPMLYPTGTMTMGTAMAWALNVENDEIADILCHRLLRQASYAQAMVSELLSYSKPQVRYTAFRLLLNILLIGNCDRNANLRPIVECELETAPANLKPLLNSILEEQ